MERMHEGVLVNNTSWQPASNIKHTREKYLQVIVNSSSNLPAEASDITEQKHSILSGFQTQRIQEHE